MTAIEKRLRKFAGTTSTEFASLNGRLTAQAQEIAFLRKENEKKNSRFSARLQVIDKVTIAIEEAARKQESPYLTSSLNIPETKREQCRRLTKRKS